MCGKHLTGLLNCSCMSSDPDILLSKLVCGLKSLQHLLERAWVHQWCVSRLFDVQLLLLHNVLLLKTWQCCLLKHITLQGQQGCQVPGYSAGHCCCWGCWSVLQAGDAQKAPHTAWDLGCWWQPQGITPPFRVIVHQKSRQLYRLCAWRYAVVSSLIYVAAWYLWSLRYRSRLSNIVCWLCKDYYTRKLNSLMANVIQCMSCISREYSV